MGALYDENPDDEYEDEDEEYVDQVKLDMMLYRKRVRLSKQDSQVKQDPPIIQLPAPIQEP